MKVKYDNEEWYVEKIEYPRYWNFFREWRLENVPDPKLHIVRNGDLLGLPTFIPRIVNASDVEFV